MPQVALRGGNKENCSEDAKKPESRQRLMSSDVPGNRGSGGGENLVMSPLTSSAAESAVGCQPSCGHPGHHSRRVWLAVT